MLLQNTKFLQKHDEIKITLQKLEAVKLTPPVCFGTGAQTPSRIIQFEPRGVI